MSCNEEELLHATRNCIIDCSSPLRCVENTISTAKLHAKGGTMQRFAYYRIQYTLPMLCLALLKC